MCPIFRHSPLAVLIESEDTALLAIGKTCLQQKGTSMAGDVDEFAEKVDDFAEEILAGTIAAVIRHYEGRGHMPEYAIYYVMKRLQAALPRACSQAGITDSDYQEIAIIEIRHP